MKVKVKVVVKVVVQVVKSRNNIGSGAGDGPGNCDVGEHEESGKGCEGGGTECGVAGGGAGGGGVASGCVIGGESGQKPTWRSGSSSRKRKPPTQRMSHFSVFEQANLPHNWEHCRTNQLPVQDTWTGVA